MLRRLFFTYSFYIKTVIFIKKKYWKYLLEVTYIINQSKTRVYVIEYYSQFV